MSISLNYDTFHPHYRHRRDQWIFNEHHFLGGRNLRLANELEGRIYLQPHTLEDDDAFQNRLFRAPGLYDNLPRRGLEVYQSQLFRVSPTRMLPPALEEMRENVNMQGTDADDFFRNAAEQAQLHGITYVLCDAPVVDLGLTELDRRERQLRPWFEHVPTLHLTDWSVEQLDVARRGMLNYVVIRDNILMKPFAFKPQQNYIRYRVWYRDRWEVILMGSVQPNTVAGKSVDGQVAYHVEGPNPLGEVPLVPFYDKRLGPMMGHTIMDDVCWAANALWNRSSVEDESFQYQGFNQLVVESDRDISTMKLGQSRAIPLQGGGDEKAYYLEPSKVPTESFESFATRTVERVTDLIFARTHRQTAGAQQESAAKRRMDREEFLAMLQAKASNFEESEAMCWGFAQQWEGGPSPMSTEFTSQGLIEYNKDFEVDQTEPKDWEKKVEAGVRNRTEWYISEHPGTPPEEAEKAVQENLDGEAELRKDRFEEMADVAEAAGLGVTGAAAGGFPPKPSSGNGATPPNPKKPQPVKMPKTV